MSKTYKPAFEDDYNPTEDLQEMETKDNIFDGTQTGVKIRKKETMSEKMQFFVYPSTKEKITAYAKEHGVSYADVVRSLMYDFIEKNGL